MAPSWIKKGNILTINIFILKIFISSPPAPDLFWSNERISYLYKNIVSNILGITPENTSIQLAVGLI